MKGLKLYALLAAVCAPVAVLDGMYFAGSMRYAGMIEFCLLFVAIGVTFFEWGQAVTIAMFCGFLLDTMSEYPYHMALFTAYAMAGKWVSKFFYSNKSPLHVAAQLMLFALFTAGMFVAQCYPFRFGAPALEPVATVVALNCALVLPALVFAPGGGKKFKVYKL